MSNYILAQGIDTFNSGIPQNELIPLEKALSITDYAENIHNVINCDDDIIIINSELKLNEYELRAKLQGIELLKWLRIKHKLTNPIIVTGFLDLQYILSKHPEHIILTSPGTRYLRLPFTDKELQLVTSNLKPLNNVEEQLKSFVRADFKVEEFGHQLANDLGLSLLQYIHSIYQFKKNEFKLETLNDYKAKLLFENFTVDDSQIQEVHSFWNSCNKYQKDKKVIYIDDQGEEGWFKLFSQIFPNLKKEYIQPKGTFLSYSKKIIETVAEISPDCILLDLRLEGVRDQNKELKDISGYKLLKKISETFPSLPVVIVSATNNATTVTKLLENGAKSFWGKPRVEHIGSGITDCYTNLLLTVSSAVNHYRFEEEKISINTNFLIKQKSKIPQGFIDCISTFDAIITDTNCWMMTIQNNDRTLKTISKLHLDLFNISKIAKKNFIILDEIQRELLVHQYKLVDEEKIEQQEKAAITAKYGLELLNRIIKEENLFVQDHHLRYNYGNRYTFKYSCNNNEIEEIAYRDEREIFKRKYYDTTGLAQGDIDEKLHNLNKRRKVHADDTFINIIYNVLESTKEEFRKSNILFISDDTECIDNIRVFIENMTKNNDINILESRKIHGVIKMRNGYLKGKNRKGNNFKITFINPFELKNFSV